MEIIILVFALTLFFIALLSPDSVSTRDRNYWSKVISGHRCVVDGRECRRRRKSAARVFISRKPVLK